MIHAWFDGDLNVPALPDWLVPYFEGVQNFVAETGFEPVAWEQAIYEPIHRYAGKYDVRGKMRGQRLPALVDFKSGEIGKWTRVQLAAYTCGKPHARVAVGLGAGLSGGKNYECEVYGIDTLAKHLQVFHASLIIARFHSGG